MASFQSSLEDADIADELAAGQRAISIAEFFEKNKHMLGFDSEARALVTAVKEGVDNSLDATEEAGFLPDIYVEIKESGDYYNLIIEDNGPGITKEQIPKIFGKMLYGSRFHKREQSLTPDQQIMVKADGDPKLVEIGDLCDAFIPDADGAASERVSSELQAPCFDRGTGEVSWHDVTHVHRHETDHEVYRIKTARGRTIEVTGNHSLFTLDSTGEVAEVEARKLSPEDHVVGPETIPALDHTQEINILSYIPRSALDERNWYVYDLNRAVIREIKEQAEVIRKPSPPDGDRLRYFYRLNGVDILHDSYRQYLEKGYLPADIVSDFGWEDRVADGVIRTYQVGGEATEVPVTIPLSSQFMRFMGLFVAEGHSGERQVGFTFGDHEDQLIEEIEQTASDLLGVNTTTVARQRNSTRVKAFGSPLAVFLAQVCGVRAENKRIPSFVFSAPNEAQQAFIDALYDGDGSEAHPQNQLEYATVSHRLARDLTYLWSMRGVVASLKTSTTDDNIVGKESTVHRVIVYGQDIEKSEKYRAERTRLARYRRLPASIVENLTERICERETVQPNRAGVFYAAGLGSSQRVAQKFVRWVEYILEDGDIPQNFYRETLEDAGLLTASGEPTRKLEEFWERSERLIEFMESDLCLLPIEEVTQIEPPGYVYDISVPGTGADENFVAGNQGPLFVKNSRGQQGIGISAAVLYAQLTSGTPTKITSRTPKSSEASYYELIIDTEENEPEIQREDTTTWDRPHGTRIELRLEANMRARQQLHDYITYTAIVNPHARIELIEPDAEFKFDRATDELPAETTSIRPHPHGVELGTLIKMLNGTDSYSLSGFLQGEFTRVGGKTAEEVLDAFRDRFFGREMPWGPPRSVEDVDLARALQNAVVNKGADATAAFAERVADGVADAGAVAHHELERLVNDVADDVEEEFDANFGATVRENAVEAGWDALTADRVTPLYELIREATSSRKDDETVRAFVERLAPKFDGTERDRFTHARLVEFVDRAAEKTAEYEDVSFGETARENVVEAVWDAMRRVPDELPSVSEVARDRDAAADLIAGMRSVDVMAPPTNCLSPITAELIEEGLRKEVDADFYQAVTRDAEVQGGDPFIVEAGIAYGGELAEESKSELLRFANRVPLVYQQGACAITDVIRGIDWRNYGLDQPGGSGMPGGPAMVLVHVASTNVPFTSESKDAVANVPEIEKQVELAVREAARGMKAHLNKRRSLQQRRQKQSVIADILPKMAAKVASVTGRDPPPVDESLARIMNNVLVAREANGDGIELVVENHTDAGVDLEVSEVLDAEPENASDGRVVDLDDGEWVVKWNVTVGAGETATLTYDVDADAESDLTVDGPETEKLTIQP